MGLCAVKYRLVLGLVLGYTAFTIRYLVSKHGMDTVRLRYGYGLVVGVFSLVR